MMNKRILADLEPKKVFHFFEDLCAIPHGSGNTKAISDYCVAFAKERSLRYVQDEHNNVVIYADGTAGYEDHGAVIIQGHLDMVANKEPDCTLDMTKDGLDLAVADGYVYAKGTTLGGDDGIAVAYALAILDDPAIPHPPIEAVFTVDEEVGLLGAAAMDCSVLKGRKLLNIDSEEEGILTVGCAGGGRCDMVLPISYSHACGLCCKLSLHDFAGGHSGVEINKGRANAIKLSGEIIKRLNDKCGIQLQSVHGGMQDNAISREVDVVFFLAPEQKDAARAEIEAWWSEVRAAYAENDPNGTYTYTDEAELCGKAVDTDTTAKIAKLICDLPCGVQAMSQDIPGLVETSLNLGIVRMNDDEFHVTASVRSSVTASLDALKEQLRSIIENAGGSFSKRGEYPAWEYRKDSPLRDTMVSVYKELYGKEPVVEAIHAGLECGLFSDKLPGLDSVSFGPNLLEIHTPRERADIASIARTWDYLLKILEKL